MEAIADSLGYETTFLTDADATAQAVLDAFSGAARECRPGDILLYTFSGHGGQQYDVSGDEPEKLDEFSVFYNRIGLDDELYAALAAFSSGVRIYSCLDSCHSRTGLKVIYRELPQFPPLARAYGLPSGKTTPRIKTLPTELRIIPEDVQSWFFKKNRELYASLKARTRDADPRASIIVMSGCQDNQLSSDGEVNGLFTEKLLEVWAGGDFSGDYKDFYDSISAKMPPTQSPGLEKLGVISAEFLAQKPFSIVGSTPTSETKLLPSVSGPETVKRSGLPPSFDVFTGSNNYYIFEITSEPRLFNDERRNNGTNFYASWDDASSPARLTAARYTLPASAWEQIRDNERLWFRIGTTSSANGWDNYMLSTEGTAVSSAPAFDITGTRVLAKA
jgi:hypothetical protein